MDNDFNINVNLTGSAEEITKAMIKFSEGAAAINDNMYRLANTHVHRSFKCARCKKTYPVALKGIAERRQGIGIVAWCLGCICSQVSSWEHPWSTEMRPVFNWPTAMRLPTLYEARRFQ